MRDTNRDSTDEAGSIEPATRWLIVAIAELSAILLLVLHEGIVRQWPGFADQGLRLLLYTLAIAPPLMLALAVERLAERFTFVAIGLLALPLAGIAVHTGNDCLPGRWGCNAVSMPYWTSLGIALFVLLPFLQTWRDAATRLPTGLPYTRLYHHAWDNALALAATAAFVAAAWAVLWLWGALFALIGIPEFRELFEKPRFVYPVTGLITGFGLVMSRAQGGALRAVLRLCLSLARALLPLVMLLALLFLAVVALKGPEALWQTRRAASLLLWLVLFGVVLANGVYQDGSADARYPRGLRRFVSAGLLSLPAHAGLAIWAIALRVDQHGWTPDRLSAALVAVILGLHALLLAFAALPARDGRWLGRLSASNPALAAVVVVLLLASQSPLLDFRAITVDSQLARLARGEISAEPAHQTFDCVVVSHTETRTGKAGPGWSTEHSSRRCTATGQPAARLDPFDIRLFARDLGRRGREALERLQSDPRHAANKAFIVAIDEALRDPSDRPTPPHPLDVADLHLLPAGTPLPAGLFEALGADLEPGPDPSQPGTRLDCHRDLRICVLLAIDLGGPDGMEWLFVPSNESYQLPPLVYGQRADGGWQLMAWVPSRYDEIARLEAAKLLDQPPTAAASRWWPLTLDGRQYPVVDGRPRLLDRAGKPVPVPATVGP